MKPSVGSPGLNRFVLSLFVARSGELRRCGADNTPPFTPSWVAMLMFGFIVLGLLNLGGEAGGCETNVRSR